MATGVQQSLNLFRKRYWTVGDDCYERESDAKAAAAATQGLLVAQSQNIYVDTIQRALRAMEWVQTPDGGLEQRFIFDPQPLPLRR